MVVAFYSLPNNVAIKLFFLSDGVERFFQRKQFIFDKFQSVVKFFLPDKIVSVGRQLPVRSLYGLSLIHI